MAAKPVVISYLRFSRPEQLKGDSIRRQLAMGDAWAEKNGLKIATQLKDLGVSAYRGKNAVEGALGQFLKLVDEGKIPRGSTLLVESLDRLSRQQVLDAFQRFIGIVNAGITIVTLADNQTYTRETLNGNFGSLMFSLMIMSRAHEESAMKAQRLAQAWVGKRARIGQKVLTRQIPAWLRVEGDKLVIDKTKAAVVRRMIKLALDGYGANAIVKKMNDAGVNIGRVPYFQRSYVAKILHSRALIGEFQPHKNVYTSGRKSRVPVGDPIVGYYPPLIDETTFLAVQAKLRSRRLTGGPSAKFTNVLAGLVYDASDGSRMHVQNKGGGDRRLASSAAICGRRGASAYLTVPLSVLEKVVILQLHDLILPHLGGEQDDDARVEAAALEARIAEVDRRIEAAQEAMLSDSAVATQSVIAVIAKLDGQKKKLTAELEKMRSEIAGRASMDLGAARDRVAAVLEYYRGERELSEEQRVELRQIMRDTVSRIDCEPSRTNPAGRSFTAKLKITLRDGSAFDLFITASVIDRMQRNALGHPVKSSASKGPPRFHVGVSDARWIVLNDQVHRMAKPKAKLSVPTIPGVSRIAPDVIA